MGYRYLETFGKPKGRIKKGHLEFELQGEKLHGKWMLVRTQKTSGKKEQWLLIKRSDDEYNKPQKMPKFISPQLALLAEDPPQGNDWVHETKFDGYRTQAHLTNGIVKLYSRSGLNWTRKYSQIKESLVEKLEYPDQIVMDFDPSPGISWKQIIQAALDLKKILDKLKLKSFVKLSDGKGLHVHIPIEPIYGWDQIKSFAKALAQTMEQNNDLYTVEISKKKTGPMEKLFEIKAKYFHFEEGALEFFD